jgi:hypothetical protein
MEIVNFVNSSAAFVTLSWVADDDYILVGFVGIPAVLSKDPNRTYTNTAVSPTPTGTNDNWFVTTFDTGWQFFQLNFPIAKGMKIYCAMTNSAGSAAMYLERVSQLVS